ncbi:Uncharacterised protein [Vibrio cholerae]|nr:Uncharacterised protein [Vibrio cholerae]
MINKLARLRQITEWKHFTIDGVFQAEQFGAGKMCIIRFDRGFEFGEIECAIRFIVNRLWLDRAKYGSTASFITIVMGLLATQIFVAAFAMGE